MADARTPDHIVALPLEPGASDGQVKPEPARHQQVADERIVIGLQDLAGVLRRRGGLARGGLARKGAPLKLPVSIQVPCWRVRESAAPAVPGASPSPAAPPLPEASHDDGPSLLLGCLVPTVNWGLGWGFAGGRVASQHHAGPGPSRPVAAYPARRHRMLAIRGVPVFGSVPTFAFLGCSALFSASDAGRSARYRRPSLAFLGHWCCPAPRVDSLSSVMGAAGPRCFWGRQEGSGEPGTGPWFCGAGGVPGSPSAFSGLIPS
jgi:hypothetical protein